MAAVGAVSIAVAICREGENTPFLFMCLFMSSCPVIYQLFREETQQLKLLRMVNCWLSLGLRYTVKHENPYKRCLHAHDLACTCCVCTINVYCGELLGSCKVSWQSQQRSDAIVIGYFATIVTSFFGNLASTITKRRFSTVLPIADERRTSQDDQGLSLASKPTAQRVPAMPPDEVFETDSSVKHMSFGRENEAGAVEEPGMI